MFPPLAIIEDYPQFHEVGEYEFNYIVEKFGCLRIKSEECDGETYNCDYLGTNVHVGSRYRVKWNETRSKLLCRYFITDDAKIMLHTESR